MASSKQSDPGSSAPQGHVTARLCRAAICVEPRRDTARHHFLMRPPHFLAERVKTRLVEILWAPQSASLRHRPTLQAPTTWEQERFQMNRDTTAKETIFKSSATNCLGGEAQTRARTQTRCNLVELFQIAMRSSAKKAHGQREGTRATPL